MTETANLELPCPSCGYNVVEQVLKAVARCPECGTTLATVEVEPRDSLAARWSDLHRYARSHPVFMALAVANLVVLLLCVLRFPRCLESYWDTPPIYNRVGDVLWYLFWPAMALGAILPFASFFLVSRRCIVLGLLNGVCAFVDFCLLMNALAQL